MRWLPQALDTEAGQPLTIEKAYRLGKILQQTKDQRGSDGIRSWTLLAKFLTYHIFPVFLFELAAVLLLKRIRFQSNRDPVIGREGRCAWLAAQGLS